MANIEGQIEMPNLPQRKRPGKYTLKWLKGDEKMIGLADFDRGLGV